MRKLLLLVALLTFGVGAKAQEVTFSIDDVEIPQGGTVQIPINVTNSIAIKAAFQGILTVDGVNLEEKADDALFIHISQEEKEDAETGEPVMVDVANFTPSSRFTSPVASFAFSDGQYKLVVYDGTGAALSSRSGSVGYITLSASASAVPGTEYNATLKEINTANNSTGENIPVEDVNFTIKVVENIYTLDENSTVAPVMAENVKVKVNRTINAGNWSTLVLPFDMTEDQCKEKFGDDVKIAEFTGYELAGNDDISVKFADVKEIKANTPCIIKVSTAINGFIMDNVTVSPSDDPSVNYGSSRKPKAIIGIYTVETLEDGILFLNSNNFYYSTGSTKMKALRAYFDFTDFDPSAGAKIRFDVDGDATSIDGISEITKYADGVYSVTGAKVSEDSLEGLPAGVYIVNGKKVYKK